MDIPYITPDKVEAFLSWNGVMEAMIEGHRHEKAQIDDMFLRQSDNTLLNRAAAIQGLGMGVKCASIFPGNPSLFPPQPSVNSMFLLFNESTGTVDSLIDGNFLTKWKTAGDSILGSRFLARPDSKTLTILGAGVVAESLISAYADAFPKLEQALIWNRSHVRAENLADRLTSLELPVNAVLSLQEAVEKADILSSATMSREPLIKGDWVQPGTHVDLIGAFRPDMREADDDLLSKSRLFVDARETTLEDIGELMIPLESGVIGREDVLGDFYDLCNGSERRTSDSEITLFKNGGGAHLDLMTAKYICRVADSLQRF
ncbi:ornithine cyclodeaminase family protein [Endozoicomonas arenosclerae]|uniref:ornithine cyclodeaminase family protein n=1 Tax=Endozoicomonas arenosclerae TaxID=1633495 RepID=UPI0007812228|nr:ornithine cyclodeaminase [Endozoicomonas arenosclerae]